MNILMVIFGLVAILAVVGTVQGFKERNILSIVFNLAAVVIFGAFTVATIVYQGYPPKLH
ncbi:MULTISPECIES: DUF2759 domain-containing protein [unclassified Sporosarcina]|uniref:DUF2759 domain-containing protein n=1 Tax=unclassified Sporosarcina TaxID=2647733 RepID=UPI00161A0E9B|nr:MULTISPECIES: DUF2759 domain-containing protein [unclassified Sporosarcina]MBB4825718.1 putative small integral membrane protein [Sporosarcina luteola]QTD41696.1 DUF2759 domain-containing protein [Sporosarcina sp. Te-1]